ncbi:hypothetical protein A1O3_10452 [Capronia epimyces CBS 606.96]|uniref:Transaldolase n=1 Tax=Capronia epimyces CBS 606.96 TaxID=1182542 RepID=W9Y4A1_9EURO|nr:uncharacterized protein A1O3_10452 [Capronia epimyces CBS 606.96]EXJ77294.1 hypothetical protein A1O3_10452 [Capronia epimyces CBS 606.96]
MLLPEFRDLYLSKVKEFGDQGWEEVFNRVSVQFCANNLENITGRVLVQVTPSRVYDKEAVLAQCYAYDRAFRDAGVSRDRYAIKVAVTGPAMAAAEQLNREGIRMLGTSLFGLPQAIACAQAGCLYISPYFNEVAAYSDESLMHKGSDPALTHPMSARLIHILETYTRLYEKTGKEPPLIVIASNANVAEVLATAELGCQHITILAPHLKELTETPLDDEARKRYPLFASKLTKRSAPYYANLKTPSRLAQHSTSDPLAGPDWDGTFASTDVDYLANDGKALDEAIARDTAVAKKLKDILQVFGDACQQAKEAIESEYAQLKK